MRPSPTTFPAASHPAIEPIHGLIDGTNAIHLEHLAKVPDSVHVRVRDSGLGAVYLGTGPVTQLDDMGHLKGKRPLGWPAGTTWDDVRGCYDRDRKAIVCGTGDGGSASVALHEYGHAAADLTGLERDPHAMEWHSTLFPHLGKYYRQDGPGSPAGVQELLAESFAVYWSDGEEELAKFARSKSYARWFAQRMKELSDGTSATG